MTTDGRVLLDATAIPADRGGVGRYVEQLVEALARIAPDRVEVVCQARDAQAFRDIGATVLPRSAWLERTPLRLLWEQTGLPLLARRRGAAVIHSPHYTFPLLMRGRRVVTLHDATFFTDPDVHTPLKRVFFRWWTQRAAARADAVVVPSAATADELRRLTSRRDYAIAPHGVDLDVFHPPTDADRAARPPVPSGDAGWIAFLGTLEPRKNLPALVRAYSRLASAPRSAGVPALVLAGGRGWDTELETAVAGVAPPGRVVRPGFVPTESLRVLLGDAEIVVYPSLGEGFGLPVLEAMACGAAVLTTRRLSLPEVGGDAVAYSGTTEDEIAEALADLLDDPARRADLRSRAVERAATFTWERSARIHLDVYRSG